MCIKQDDDPPKSPRAKLAGQGDIDLVETTTATVGTSKLLNGKREDSEQLQ